MPTTRHPSRRTIAGAATAAGAVALLSACQPVPGNLKDTTPPAITFKVGGTAVAAGSTIHLGSAAKEIVITAKDGGGIESLFTSLENRFVCTHGSASITETDTNPASNKGYGYDISTHSYLAQRTAPDDFWPDVDHDGVKDASEHHLRYDELFVVQSKSIVQQSINAYTVGSDCLMADGTTHGTVTSSKLIVRATAVNTRGEILSAPTAQKRTVAKLTIT